ncbi:MAG TPA: CapA family protein [Dehalococcoidia bacterium]|nr:CapA family protein [Dehalococcoidia bacterium]
MRFVLLLVAAIGTVALVACDSDAPPTTIEPSEVSATASPATATPEPPDDRLKVAFDLSREDERREATASVSERPQLVSVDEAAAADILLSDVPLDQVQPLVLATWVAITDQRRDVLDLTINQVRRVMAGAVDDWSQLGGSTLPLTLVVPSEKQGAIYRAFDTAATTYRTMPLAEVAPYVASTPGALALVPVEALRLGVLALTVDGHDPYRDPAKDSPLRLERWLRLSGRAAAVDFVATMFDGDSSVSVLDPVGVIVTGELIPARCTDAALEEVGDFGAMFDGTRELLLAADVAVVPLEVALTDLSPPTPCTPTFVLQGRAEVVDAIAEAGIDMMLVAGNHAMDCWNGCSGVQALFDTLDRFDRAAVAHTGGAANIEDARTATVVERDGVRFAFLAYDSIAPWYAATGGSPGTAPIDLTTLAEDVAAAAARADFVVVGFGWGVEYTADPIAFQREAAAIAVAAGASLIVGNHPHWVQAVEAFSDATIGDALVAYSLGNFVFDQSWSVPTTQGMVLEAGFANEQLIGYRLRPIVIRGNPELTRGLYRPEFVDPASEGAPILGRVWDASDRLPARD